MNVANKRAATGNFVLYGFLFIVLLALNGFLNFIAASFSWDTLLTPTYWLKTVAGAASGLGAFVIFSFLRRDSSILSDEEYNKKIVSVNNTVRGNVGPDFPDFISEKNLTSKINKWKEIMENKMMKWTRKVPSSVLNTIRILEEHPDYPNKSNWKWYKKLTWYPLGAIKWSIRKHRANKWLRKKESIKLQLTDEWINKNIYYIKIDYPETTPGEILNGERNSKGNKVIDNGAIRHILSDRLPLIALTMTLQGGYHALVITGTSNPVGMWVGILVQLSTMLLNVGAGLHYGKTLFARLDLNNLTTREQYLMEYLIWTKKKKSAAQVEQ